MMHVPITIRDEKSDTTAEVAPTLGFNCFRLCVGGPEALTEVLWSAPDFLAGQSKPSHSGIPLMFPFAGRLRGTSFEFAALRYTLEAGDGRGNAIHGFVLTRPWRATQPSADRVVGTFQASRDDAALLARWPADFRITADYRVAARSLVCEYLIENPDDKPLPFGFGTHPYFRVPLGGPSAAECIVQVPVSTAWELVDLLPTGKIAPASVAAELSAGMPFGKMELDNVFGGLAFENHRAAASVRDPGSKRAMTMTFDDQNTACVVYNPPHRQAVCIEPYTTAPDAFYLQSQGIDPHLRVLAPGASFRTRIEIHVS
ncbi:MAG: aldose 1-epimerase [Pirellulales bacterium]